MQNKTFKLTAKEKKLPSWRRAQLRERYAKLNRWRKAKGEIDILYYKFVSKGFFEAKAITFHEKIAFEGFMCGGVLKQFIKKVLAEGGIVKRVRYALVDKEAKEDLRRVTAELKGLYARVNHAGRILKLKPKDR